MSDTGKKSEISKREEEILSFWEENDIFEKTLKKTEGGEEFVFYEGPPTANGRPGIHHIESRAFKDAIPRYKTMQGYHVRRKAGWDTHGLPVELEVEKEIGISSKKEIEEYGIGKFNEKCKESVWKYVDEWIRFTKRIGYWLDLDNPYVTYESSYIESLWYVLKQINEDGRVYKDYKVVPWCPRCGTALSSHELAQGYKEVKDLSVTAKFELIDEQHTFILAWTTTPWTLPGNVALAVGADIDYIKIASMPDVRDGLESGPFQREYYWVAENVFEQKADPITPRENEETFSFLGELVKKTPETRKGSEFLGKAYKPLYPFLKEHVEDSAALEKLYRIYEADFVTTDDGTGIVHTAVMYGQDDFELGDTVGLPKVHLVDENGHFIEGTDFLAGLFVKEEETDVEIIKDLHHRGLLFAKEKYEHTYPHCWRCKTPLIYYARDSWYIRMSELKDQLLEENEKINWEPAHLKHGRFGEWLEGVRDWAISRERYWGTPLPIWENEDGSKRIFIGSLEELKKKSQSTNRYFVMRHGEAEQNVNNTMSSDPADNASTLTEKGQKEVKEAVKHLEDKSIDLIVYSPLVRTKETAHIVAEELGLGDDVVIADERIAENKFGEFEGKSHAEYSAFMGSPAEHFVSTPKGGENFTDVKRRVGECLYDIDSQHENKNILFVGHEGPLWTLIGAASSATVDEMASMLPKDRSFLPTGQVRELTFTPLPHNKDYELDLHRPYIDEITWNDDGDVMRRTPEVMDVWFDSGAMPFAQDHYPFENKEWVDGPGFPASFISEAIDQTRGWFYTLHAVSVLLGRGHAYRNVISLGHLLDAEGQKMSKSKGNTIDPWEMADTYGVDTLRFWMYSVNQPGESKNFDERTVDEIVKKVFNILRNVVRFWEMYRDDDRVEVNPRESENILDIWIIARLDSLVEEITKSLDNFNLIDPTRALRDFIGDDLSRWYIRRSRDRFKSEDSKDREYALATTRFVVGEVAKLMAPFTPFISEEIYMQVVQNGEESVHLEAWPEVPGDINSELLTHMARVRHIVSEALDARSQEGMKVRQPLSRLSVSKKYDLPSELKDELVALIADEVNVKEVVFSDVEEVELDFELTPALIQEGNAREFIRAVQSLRKKEALDPGDEVVLVVSTDDAGKDVIEAFRDEIVSTASLSDISYGEVDGGEKLELEEVAFEFSIQR